MEREKKVKNAKFMVEMTKRQNWKDEIARKEENKKRTKWITKFDSFPPFIFPFLFFLIGRGPILDLDGAFQLLDERSNSFFSSNNDGDGVDSPLGLDLGLV